MADRILRVSVGRFGLIHLTFEEYDELKRLMLVDLDLAEVKVKEYREREEREKREKRG